MARQQSAAAPTALATTTIEATSNAIEHALKEYGVHAISKLERVQQIIRMSQGINSLRKALTDDFMRDVIMPMQGTPLGFLTDMDNKLDPKTSQPGYPLGIVRECVIEAMLRGFSVVGNEMNIIASRFYGTKNGFERLVTTHPGLTDLVMQAGVPDFKTSEKGVDRGAMVPFTASWRLHGKPMSLDCLVMKDGTDMRIPVRVNAGMGADGIIGKATRKMYFRIYQRITGSTFGLVDGDVSEAEPILTTGTPAPAQQSGAKPAVSKGAALDSLAADLKAKQKKSEPPPAPANDDGQLTVAQVLDALVDADESWSRLPTARATAAISAWSPDEQRRAHAWATTFVQTAEDQNPPEQPEFCFAPREPGEEG